MATKSAKAFVGPVMPAVVEAAPQAPVAHQQAALLFTLGGKAAQVRNTLQAGGKTGLGANWRAVAKPATNTRAIALAALAGITAPFTEAQALEALGTVKASLGSGTPRSYYKAFIASGYIVAAMD